MPTAFVLAGGASLGAIEAGMIEALYERGIRPDMLVGTSAGGLNAAFLAARPPQPATAHELQERWRTVRRGDVFPLRPRTLIGGLLGIRSHLVPPDGLRRLIRQWIGVERIEATAIDLAIVVCDLLTGE